MREIIIEFFSESLVYFFLPESSSQRSNCLCLLLEDKNDFGLKDISTPRILQTILGKRRATRWQGVGRVQTNVSTICLGSFSATSKMKRYVRLSVSALLYSSPLSYIKLNPIETTADGSALIKIGNTSVICGVKAELFEPLPGSFAFTTICFILEDHRRCCSRWYIARRSHVFLI